MRLGRRSGRLARRSGRLGRRSGRLGRRSGRQDRDGGSDVDRGSGTIWVVVVMSLVASFAVGAAAVGGAVVARYRASSAADFAALAGADALARASADPCSAAQRVVQQYGADLKGCVIEGMEVEVLVELPAGGLIGPTYRAEVRARAGPP